MRKLISLIPLLLLLGTNIFAQTSDINNRFMLGQSFEQAGEIEKSKSIYEELYKLQPQNQLFFQNLNRVYITLKDYKKSIALIEASLKANPTDINLYGLLGSSYYLDGKEKIAFATWEDGIKLDPTSEITYRLMANFALERRAFEKAIDILKKGKSISKDTKTFSYDLANLYSVTMNYADATEEYASVLTYYPDQYPFIESRILAYVAKPEALDVTIKILEKRKTDSNVSFLYLLSHLYLEKKNFEKAFDYYLIADKKLNRQGAELFSFGQKVFNEGNDEVAAKTFDYIITNYPGSSFFSSSKLAYAKCLEAKFEREAANNTYDWLSYSTPKTGNETEYKKILEIYNGLIKQYPFTEVAIEAYYRMGTLYYSRLNSTAKAKEFFNIIIKDYTLSQFYVPACDFMSDIYLSDGDLTSSTNCLNKITTNNRRTDAQFYSALFKKAKICFYKNDFTGAKEILATNLTNLSDNSANDAIELSLLINTTIDDSIGLSNFAAAELLAEKHILPEAAEKFRQIALKKESIVLSNTAAAEQAEILIALGKYPEAIELLNKISDEREKNIYSDKALYLKAKTFQYLVKDIPKAIDAYQEILAKYPNSMYLEDSRNEITKNRNKSS